ncbi:MAG: MFS transporter [Thaumarchaeota archaeon]|nr:MFS transporter [Nitrososphaerota archaeon]
MDYKWIALTNTTLTILMASLDTNIVIIALPKISSDLHTSVLETMWIVLCFGLVTTIVLLSFGRLADMFGRVKLYNLGLIVFTVGSALCGFSSSGQELILFRSIQALGAAFLFSNSAAILTDAFDAKERGKALGLNQVSIVVGSVAGLVLGGLLTDTLGWRSIFWVNVPIGTFGAVWSYTKLKELGAKTGGRVDWIGNCILASGLVSLFLGLTLGSLQIFSSTQEFLLIFGGLGLLVLFVYVESKINDPMFDVKLFRIRVFNMGNFSVFFNAVARGALILVMSLYLQGPTMKLSPLETGLYLIPISFTMATFGPISGWLSDKHGSKIFIIGGLLTSATGFLILTTLQQHESFVELLAPLVLIGAGMGMFAAPNRTTVMNSVPAQRRGIASGMTTTLVTLGNTASLGISFLIITKYVPITDLETVFVGKSVEFSNGVSFVNAIHMIFLISATLLLASMIPSIIERLTKSQDGYASYH